MMTTVSLACHRQPADNQIADSPSRKASNGFGGDLIVIEDPAKFVEDWQRPETPKFSSATVVKRGVRLGAVVIFAGCKRDPAGICNAEVDYAIYKPDGSLYQEQKGLPLWKEPAPPSKNFQLGRAILSFRTGPSDQVGQYRVTAKCTDLNADVTLELETTFELQ
jgi:hypothetical protein